MTRPVRVMAVASAGGHWVQLLRLRPAWDGCEVIYVTTNAGFRDVVIAAARERGQPVPTFYAVREANRWQKLRLILQFLGLVGVVLKVRPDVVITTGAAPGYFAIRLAKLLGAKCVWLDSIANAAEMSLSGRKIGPHADLWLTQWPDLAGPEGPDYVGAVF